jgi:ABC-type multidrug transport system fused ATPase/permease subunit
VASNERVGVVGRTGAGKYSLILALLRFLEPTAGEILIDGVDISTLKIDQLRGRLAIIPQHPVIFQGTVRSNLDPFHDHEDADLLAALQVVGWSMEGLDSSDDTSRAYIDSAFSFEESGEAGTVLRCLAPEKLQSPLDQLIMDGGRNLSQGQRQLLCVARVLIQRPKILILDDATSAVDKGTDKFIQRMLREVLGSTATIIAIAHWLSTIVDFDQVLMMDVGRVAEYGPPRVLLRIENGVFRGMVERDPEQDLLKSTINCSSAP